MFSLRAVSETTIHLICLKTGELLTASHVHVGALKMLRGSIIIHFGQFEQFEPPRIVSGGGGYYSVLVCFNYSTLSSSLRAAEKELQLSLCLPEL